MVGGCDEVRRTLRSQEGTPEWVAFASMVADVVQDVTVEQVVRVARQNVAVARKIIKSAVPHIVAHDGPCPQANALAGAIMTRLSAIPDERRAALAPLVAKYLG